MCAGMCATLMAVGERLRAAMPLRVQAKWTGAFGALWTVGVVCACGRQLDVRPIKDGLWSGSVWGRAAALSAAVVLSSLVLQHARCRSFVVSLCTSSWTDALLFLPSATAFFMPVACGGVEYPWAFWSALVPMVVGPVAVVTVVALLARQRRFAFGTGRRRHICGLFAAVRLPTSALLQIVALWAVLWAVPRLSCIPAAIVVGSWTTTLTLLSIATAVAAVATAVSPWVARIVLSFSARGICFSLVLGVLAGSFLLCRDGDGQLGASNGASTPALLARTVAAAGRRAWLATTQSSAFTAGVGVCQASAGAHVPLSFAGVVYPCGSMLKASCTLLLSWTRAMVSILSAAALLSTATIKVVDAAGSGEEKTES